MAFADNIDETLQKDIKKKLGIDENDFNTILNLFANILSLIEKNYLSHLKTAIEDTINEKMKAELLNQLKQDPAISLKTKNNIESSLKLKQYRPFTILLAPVIGEKRASTRRIQRSALISYDPRVEKKQLRIFLAHEFGHIIIREFCSDSQLKNEENNANLFAYLAILDKDKFYKLEAEKLTHHDELQLLNEVAFLNE